jgi:hypothetical protein
MVSVLKHRGFPERAAARKLVKLPTAGLHSITEQIVTGKGPLHGGPFRFQLKERVAAGAVSNDGSLPAVAPASP